MQILLMLILNRNKFPLKGTEDNSLINNIYNNVVSTDTILVAWQNTVYEPPEDSLNKGPKHVGASVKCFNVNFSGF
jgi:hypothetical protein